MTMAITAKVRCSGSVNHGDQVGYTFAADYSDEQGRAINAEWARYTPGITVSITVKPEIVFEVGKSYTLTFEAECDDVAQGDQHAG
jgi:hypothetical protein